MRAIDWVDLKLSARARRLGYNKKMATELKSNASIFLVGATATGKSALAMELAREFASSGGAAILAMDAMQVYLGAHIGTSKPSAAERGEIPHGGLDLVDLGASFDVAQYLKHAAIFLREQREVGRRVIVVGGTGLYFRALTRGLCEAPQGSDELRAELNALSTEELRERLAKIDPEMLKSLDASNPRRLVRAIEVMEATGKSLREWQAETPEPLVRDFSAFWICREKAELEKRIEERVEAMFAQGWVEEVRGLIAKYGLEAVRAFPGIGYGEIAKACGGEGSRHEEHERCEGEAPLHGVQRLPEAAADGHRPPLQVQGVKRDIWVATRQYAKRQLTWFRREPNLQEVMLTGSPSLSSVLRAAAKPSLL